MKRLGEIVQLQSYSGETIVAGGVRVTPQSQAITIAWPGGGWVWNRPVALEVEQNGQVQRVPIVDVTRWSQVVLVALTVLLSAVTVLLAVQSLVQAVTGGRQMVDEGR